MSELPRAFGVPPLVRAVMRATPEDFFVEEIMPHRPSGDGEHVWLRLEKRGMNTERLARELARIAGIPARDVGYAGLKDRNAVTVQWFSLHLPGRDDPDWTASLPPDVRLVEAVRHTRKLRRGALSGNRFVITLRQCEGECEAVAERITLIAGQGVPNYFGEQRFGRGGGNVEQARAMFVGTQRVRDRHLRGLLLSAARSEIFNEVLARRVMDGTWNRALPGEALMLDGSGSFFVTDSVDAEIERRIEAFDIHPSGPLWGRGGTAARGDAARIELDAVAAEEVLAKGLEEAGVEAARRPLRLRPCGLEGAWPDDGVLRLSFSLPAGAYATVVVREVVGNQAA